ncbi:hypothetical protein BHE74_00040094 [Ensete ventricosum]|nr:hypothetical protein BHE74_00040094 [Ensete ventricosum]
MGDASHFFNHLISASEINEDRGDERFRQAAGRGGRGASRENSKEEKEEEAEEEEEIHLPPSIDAARAARSLWSLMGETKGPQGGLRQEEDSSVIGEFVEGLLKPGV